VAVFFSFFWANFFNLATKKKGAGESNKGIFEILKKKKIAIS